MPMLRVQYLTTRVSRNISEAQRPSYRLGLALSLPWKMASMETLAFGDISDLCRPCVDCGRFTGRFCDGVADNCFAAIRVPSEKWCNGQRTPLCGPCENKFDMCHFCRGVHMCRPFAFGKVPDPQAGAPLGQPPN